VRVKRLECLLWKVMLTFLSYIDVSRMVNYLCRGRAPKLRRPKHSIGNPQSHIDAQKRPSAQTSV
jgi:hypothetical protein